MARKIDTDTYETGASSPSSYTVIFSPNGGIGHPIQMQAAAGTSINPMPLNARWDNDIRIFLGWNTRADGSGSPFTGSSIVNSDLTLYAQWTPGSTASSHTVVFNLGGGDFPSPGAEVFQTTNDSKDWKVVAPTLVPERWGFDFGGWWTQDGSGISGWGSEWNFNNDARTTRTLHARWNPMLYTLVYHQNNGSTPHSESFPSIPFDNTGTILTFNHDDLNFTPPKDPVNGDDHVFLNWNTAEPVGVSPNPEATRFYPGQALNILPDWGEPPETGNTSLMINLYAHWEEDTSGTPNSTFTVNFNLNGGEPGGGNPTNYPASLTNISSGATITRPSPDPARTGYTFAGWYTAPTGGSQWVFGTGGTEVTANTTLFAQWTLRTYNVAYNANAGTLGSPGGSTSGTTTPIEYNASYTIASNGFTLTGYSFSHWNTNAAGTGESFFPGQNVINIPGWNGTGNPPTVTLYAQWEINTYTVSFNSNGGNHVPAISDVPHGETINAPSPTPEKLGYKFVDWYKQDGSSNDNWGDEWVFGTGGTAVTDNITLHAQWEEDPTSFIPRWTVTFNSLGGTPATITLRATEGSTIPTAPTSPTRSGYAFEAWFTKDGTSDGEWGDEWKFGTAGTDTPVTTTTTLYAKWTATFYTVTFYLNDGSTDTAIETREITATSPPSLVGTLPADPVRVGHVFNGWSTSTNHAITPGTVITAATPVTANTIIYAQWTAIVVGEGSEEKPFQVRTVEDLRRVGTGGYHPLDTSNSHAWLLSSHYIQVADIDMGTVSNFAPIGNNSSTNDSTRFTGTYDAGIYDASNELIGCYTISNLTINTGTDNYAGMFGYISGATLKNITLVDVDVTGNAYVGALAGYTYNASTIENCSVRGVDSVVKGTGHEGLATAGGTYVGGLVGFNRSSSIIDSHSAAEVTGTSRYVGGLVGRNESVNYQPAAIIERSSASGDVTGEDDYVGGLVGLHYKQATSANYLEPIIRASYATGTVTGVNVVGGLVGGNATTAGANLPSLIEESYATGDVTGVSIVGGLVGRHSGGTIRASYAIGDVEALTGDYAGGLVGYQYQGSIENSYATGTVVTGNDYVGGLAGYNSGTISESYATGNVSGNNRLGGIAGYNLGTISESYATGYVTGENLYVGGLVGYNSGTISECYATGDISGRGYAGGLVGNNLSSGTIQDSYATGDVTATTDSTGSTGDYFGGIAGYISGSILHTYATGRVEGHSYAGGIVGNHGNNATTHYSVALNPSIARTEGSTNNYMARIKGNPNSDSGLNGNFARGNMLINDVEATGNFGQNQVNGESIVQENWNNWQWWASSPDFDISNDVSESGTSVWVLAGGYLPRLRNVAGGLEGQDPELQ